jgi:CrcB protein
VLNIVLVFLGGGLGAMARYGMQGVVYRWMGAAFPYGTLVVNIVGSFLIGALMSASESRFLLNPSLRIFLAIGILGGFTTFSSFSFETVSMIRDGEYLFAAMNVGASIALCLFFTYVGTLVARIL